MKPKVSNFLKGKSKRKSAGSKTFIDERIF